MKNIDKSSKEYRVGTRLIVLLCVVAALFFSLTVYITYLEIAHKDDYLNHAANQRQWVSEQNILRGEITDRNGVVLAHSIREEDGDQKRVYDYKSLYTHIIGYSSRTYGKTQLEFAYNKYLTGMSEGSDITNIASQYFDNKIGDTVKLTIDNDLQKVAQNYMGSRNGAVVAIQPKTGEILCMYSNPTFDPSSSSLEKNWDILNSSENSPFVARATSGLYAPGSIFKTIMLCAAIDNGYENFTVLDEGVLEIGDKVFENQYKRAYGEIDLKKAFAVSSNIAFMQLGLKLGPDVIRDYAKKFGLGIKTNKIEISTQKGNFDYSKKLHDGEIAQMSIGQGETLVTPYQMALMTAIIANDGINPKPHLVSRVTNQAGIPIEFGLSLIPDRVISKETAKKVREYMVEVVKNGTGRAASLYSYDVGGKTGTAENEIDNKEHTWFVGFAPAENPTIAVAVLCEYSGGTGSGNAIPIAREIMRRWLNKQ